MQTLLRAELRRTHNATKSEIHALDPMPESLLSTSISVLKGSGAIQIGALLMREVLTVKPVVLDRILRIRSVS